MFTEILSNGSIGVEEDNGDTYGEEARTFPLSVE